MLPRAAALLRVLALLALRGAQGIPQFLPCGSDKGTQMRPGETIMGQAVGAFGAGGLNVTLLRDGHPTTSFEPGEQLLVRFDGIPQQAFFACRVSDGGGDIGSAPKARALANKCASQVYAPDRHSKARTPEYALLATPCDDAPKLITVSLVAAPQGHGPFYFTSGGIRRAAGRAASCPPPKKSKLPYPFQEPINETCPNGAAAQHNAPCPAVKCVSPEGKEGTCLVSADQSWPERNGSINAEARVELLTDDVTPTSHHYVTGSAPPARAWTRDLSDWQLLIDGEVKNARNFTMDDLKKSFKHVTRRYVLECAGNWGRGIVPAYQQADWWSIGAVGCAEWTGVLLKDVLMAVGVKSSAVYVAYYGEDDFLSRGVPIEKALDGYTMLAWAMNGEPLPAFHGFPLRMLAPGFPGAAQGKWLKRLWIRDREHDGLGMLGKSYRVPKYPIRPGDYTAPDEWFKVFTQQPVRSLIVRPSRCSVTHSRHVSFHGKAWSGAGDVAKVELSYDAGLMWLPTHLSPPANKWAWQPWTANVTLPSPGVWNVFVRATDHTGATQPMLVPGWNPGGYGNNQMMKVDIEVLPNTAPGSQPHCGVCGHVYNPLKDCGGRDDQTRDCKGGVAFEDLPDSWHCPVCGAPKSHYERVALADSSVLWVERGGPGDQSEAVPAAQLAAAVQLAPAQLGMVVAVGAGGGAILGAVAVLLFLRLREGRGGRDEMGYSAFQ